ncbi:putative RNA polymerase II transcriptional coactivator [Daldinia childiae]|uniref:putative RNA polymerase II transcriptional coactivator n=1 Tax=Daldinia childiae TaxID=326645 RepID=UPI001447D7A6|nr:putative RNA polymerase II transcriptional coactivator [Daldinia childiae]KAF3058484.1 putative RNA polymerase II transcriptional coactivator [Daldinia childiae]
MGRTKNLKRSRRDEDEDEDVSSDQEVKSSSKSKSKSTKKAKTSDSGKDNEGNPFWSLGGTRRATISGFKGKTYINIREYYTDASGDLKPGKKGIMLSPEQYNKLLEAIPSINAELRDKGHTTPDISGAPADAPDSPVKAKNEKKTKPQSKKTKANIEATSDEDEDEDEDKDEDDG